MVERRTQERCPVCQGPTKPVDSELRCRNSLCSFNFRDVLCPRCQASGPEARYDVDGKLKFTCSDCQNTWADG